MARQPRLTGDQRAVLEILDRAAWPLTPEQIAGELGPHKTVHGAAQTVAALRRRDLIDGETGPDGRRAYTGRRTL